ncbi:MAG: hypothetical protein RSA53_05555 [Odoribacter sp.]
MKLFQIDYKRLVLLLLPTFLRQPRLFAFLNALTFSVSELYIRFIKNREVHLLRLKRNGQVCYLRGLLNDELDPEQRRITVTDGIQEGDWVFAMDEGEAYQLLIDHSGVIVYNESLIISNTAFFYVSVPWTKDEENLNNRLRNYINEYKLLSKKYMISYE